MIVLSSWPNNHRPSAPFRRRRPGRRGVAVRAPASPFVRPGPTGRSEHRWSGASLFPVGVGNTQQDAARFASLIDDVETRLFGELPDDTWVYPGHGKDTTLAKERPHLPDWRERGW
jgi:hypothetical protein